MVLVCSDEKKMVQAIILRFASLQTSAQNSGICHYPILKVSLQTEDPLRGGVLGIYKSIL